MASGRLRLQLLGFFLDLLDIFRELHHPFFVPHLAPLVIGIPTPIERRAQVARLIARTQ